MSMGSADFGGDDPADLAACGGGPGPPRAFGSHTGALALLAGAIGYTLSECDRLAPGEMSLATPCARWDLSALLAHLAASMADLEAAIRTGAVDPDEPSAEPGRGDPLETLRDQAARLLCVCFGFTGEEQFVAVGGLPLPAGLVACTGAVEIAVHGWDVSAARGRGHPIPPRLAVPMLGLCPLIVAGREGLFATPVRVPAGASPGDRLVGFLGREPRYPAAAIVTDE
jgi:uncharacterized protein (TIGR03086 family)